MPSYPEEEKELAESKHKVWVLIGVWKYSQSKDIGIQRTCSRLFEQMEHALIKSIQHERSHGSAVYDIDLRGQIKMLRLPGLASLTLRHCLILRTVVLK